MDKVMGNEEIDVRCPQCKEQFKQSANDIFPGSSKPFPNCGTMLQFTGEEAGDVHIVKDEPDDMDLGCSLGDLGF